MIKKRWLVEAFTWKVSSTILGILCVWLITGSLLKSGGLYLLTYTPLSTLWYIAHKKLWSNWKRRQYEKEEALEAANSSSDEEYDEC